MVTQQGLALFHHDKPVDLVVFMHGLRLAQLTLQRFELIRITHVVAREVIFEHGRFSQVDVASKQLAGVSHRVTRPILGRISKTMQRLKGLFTALDRFHSSGETLGDRSKEKCRNFLQFPKNLPRTQKNRKTPCF